MAMGRFGEEERKISLGAFFIGIAVGAVLAGGAAMLFAPKSGKETRDLIKSRANQAGQMVQQRMGDIKDKARRVAQTMRSETKKEMESAE